MVLITFKFDMAQAAAGGLSLVVWHGSHVDRAKGFESLECACWYHGNAVYEALRG